MKFQSIGHSILCVDYSYVTYFDASAAVKLVVKEPGFENVREHFHRHRPYHCMTSLCFAEALGVLKRKMERGKITREQYSFGCYQMISQFKGHHLDDTLDVPQETFMQAEALTRKYNVDLSDALQIITVKHGRFNKAADESKTVLATADARLATAAEQEGLRVWNVEKTEGPP